MIRLYTRLYRPRFLYYLLWTSVSLTYSGHDVNVIPFLIKILLLTVKLPIGWRTSTLCIQTWAKNNYTSQYYSVTVTTLIRLQFSCEFNGPCSNAATREVLIVPFNCWPWLHIGINLVNCNFRVSTWDSMAMEYTSTHNHRSSYSFVCTR